MSQLENINTPLELRTELHKMVVADLLGPAGGENEEVDEATVRSVDPGLRSFLNANTPGAFATLEALVRDAAP